MSHFSHVCTYCGTTIPRGKERTVQAEGKELKFHSDCWKDLPES